MKSSTGIVDINLIQSKVKAPWDSLFASPLIANNIKIIDDIIRDYEKIDKKIITSILISLIGIDSYRINQYSTQIKSLISICSRDTDEVRLSI